MSKWDFKIPICFYFQLSKINLIPFLKEKILQGLLFWNLMIIKYPLGNEFPFQNISTGTEYKAPWIKFLPCKHEDLSLHPVNPHQAWLSSASICCPNTPYRDKEGGNGRISWGSWALHMQWQIRDPITNKVQDKTKIMVIL